jgi:acyl dehydratase
VHTGDTVEIATTLDSIKEREGKMGAMLIAEYVTQYVNQHGETVATQRNTVIRMGVPA